MIMNKAHLFCDPCTTIYTLSFLFILRIGRRSARLVRAAAMKLAQELAEFMPRPAFSLVSRNLEG